MNERQLDLLLTSFMMAFLRLVDLVDCIQKGIALEDLEPKSLIQLDEEAREWVCKIKEERQNEVGRTAEEA